MKTYILRVRNIICLFILTLVLVACNNQTKLDTPKGLELSQYLLSWDDVKNASNYIVIIDNAGQVKVVSDNTQLDVSNFVKDGTIASFRVQAISKNNKFLDSDVSEMYNYVIPKNQLKTPLLRIENNEIIWDEVEDAKYYEVRINGHYYNTLDTIISLNKYSILYDLIDKEIKVKAISENNEITNSEVATINYTYQMSDINTKASINGFTLSVEPQEDVYKYLVSVPNSKLPDFYMSSDSYDFTKDMNFLTYGIPYEIIITPVLRHTNKLLNNYKISIMHSFTSFNGDIILEYNDSILSWNDIYEEYKIMVNDNYSEIIHQNSYDLSRFLSNSKNRNNIKVVVVGYDSYNGIYKSKHTDPLYIEIPYDRLNSPYDLRIEGNYLNWRNINNAVGYLVNINDKTYEADYSSFDLLDLEFEANKAYKIEVIAKGSDELLSRNSLPSLPLEFITSEIRLESPKLTDLNDLYFRWTKIENAIGYRIRINGKTFNTTYNYFKHTGRFDLVPGKIYDIEVLAVGNFIDNIQSDYSEIVQFELPVLHEIEPVHLTIEGNIISWEPIANVTNYTFRNNNIGIIGEGLSFDISYFYTNEKYQGVIDFYVVIDHDAEGNNNQYSRPSNKISVDVSNY